jgi:hypothetical protein
MAAKKFPRSQIKAICEPLGHDPEDVLEIAIRHNVVVVIRLSRDRFGNVSNGVFGPVTCESYHYVDEDDVDVDKPTADAAGAGS